MAEKEFAKGIRFKKASDNAPSFVLGKISINRADAINWLNTKTDE